MDDKYSKILSDYSNCINMPTCGDCKAFENIEDSRTTWCMFLRNRDSEIRNKIEEALDK